MCGLPEFVEVRRMLRAVGFTFSSLTFAPPFGGNVGAPGGHALPFLIIVIFPNNE